MPSRPTKIVIIFGGQSAEHEISTISALHVLNALDRERYDVTPIGITRDGRWVDVSVDLAALDAGTARALPSPDDSTGRELAPSVDALEVTDRHDVVVFPLLHGPMGEDGTVQGLLELAGVAYVGAGVLASAVCMDKPTSKRLLESAGLPVARWRAARASELAGDGERGFAATVERDLGYPVFVKPANMGSSVGVAKASDGEQLSAAIRGALQYDEYVVVEEAVTAREIEVGVLGNDDPVASVAGEVRPSHDFYDFDDKYVDGTAGLLVPAPLGDAEVEQARELAVAAYRALRVDGMARVDFFYEEGGRGFLVNEINTIPGFTPMSMFPQLWQASGVSYPDLVEKLVGLALERRARRAGFSTKPH